MNRRIWIAVAAVCLVAVGCGGSEQEVTEPTETTSPADEVGSLPASSMTTSTTPAGPTPRRAVAEVQSEGCDRRVVGSGVLVAETTVLTAAHIAANDPNPLVVIGHHEVLEAQLLWWDPYFDFAVLELPEPIEGALPIAMDGGWDATQEVIHAGWVEGTYVETTGEVLGSFPPADFRTSARTHDGMSGGPLLNSDGQVMGVTLGTVGEDAQTAAVSALLLHAGTLAQPPPKTVLSPELVADLDPRVGVDCAAFAQTWSPER